MKQEFEKQDELKRSALRATVALLNIPDSSKFLPLPNYILTYEIQYMACSKQYNNITLLYEHVFTLETSPLLNEFISQLRSNSETFAMLEMIKKDSGASSSDAMEIS